MDSREFEGDPNATESFFWWSVISRHDDGLVDVECVLSAEVINHGVIDACHVRFMVPVCMHLQELYRNRSTIT